MSNEFRPHFTTNKNIYAILIRAIDGAVWNGTTWETPTSTNWTTYAIALVEQSGTGFYYGSMPANQAPGLYDLNYFLRIGSQPAVSDTPISQQSIDWNGSADLGVNTITDTTSRLLQLLQATAIPTPVATTPAAQPSSPITWTANNLEQYRI